MCENLMNPYLSMLITITDININDHYPTITMLAMEFLEIDMMNFQP